MNKTFDIGAKVYIRKGKIRIDDFCLVAIDNDYNFAEILNGNDAGSFLPVVTSILDIDYCILPGFLKKSITFDDISINEQIDNLKNYFVGKEYNFTLNFLNFFTTYNENIIDEKDDFIDLVKLRATVKESIFNQDELIDKVITSLVFNQRMIDNDLDLEKIRLSKKTLLVFGKTGTGKTEVMKQVIKALDVPYVIEDATNFTIDGYKGRGVSEMLLDLYRASDYDLEEAERGVLIVDEFDKKCKTNEVSSVATTGVQQSLLKMIEGGKFTLNIEKGIKSDEIIFDTSKLTIFLVGKFGESQSKTRPIGFGKSEDKTSYNEEDLLNFGVIPELVGRISSVCKTNDFKIEDLKELILYSKISTLQVIHEIYNSFGVTLSFTEEFIDKLAKLAYEKKVGARGIKNAFDEIFEEVEFDILNGNYSKVIFDKDKIRKIGSKELEKSMV